MNDRANDVNVRSNVRGNDRVNDVNVRPNDRANDRSWTLPAIGLAPTQIPTGPWWEQRQIPSWEQKNVPWWERQNAAQWNPARALLEPKRDDGHHVKRPRPPHVRPPIVYPLPPYRYYPFYGGLGYGYVSDTYVTPPPPEEPAIETGFLRLEVEPRVDLQVFVDGIYLGTIADLGDELELRLGIHRIELRAPGHRTLVFDTEIVSDRTIVYRGALERLETSPPTPNAPGAPRTPVAPQAPEAPLAPSSPMYVIPGCYLGNVLPTAAMLRPGCDIARLTTVPR